jgi:hypothetical protein
MQEELFMALVRFGNGVSEIRGSIAGNVFSRNGSGAIIRNRINPVNPQTQAQMDVRYLFGYLAARFADLTLTQKELWDEYAALLSFGKNKLGESISYSGRQAYQMCNSNLVLAGTQIISGPPPTYSFALLNLTNTPVMNDTEKPPPIQFDFSDKSFNLILTAGAVTQFESVTSFVPPNAVDDIQAILVEATGLERPTIRNRRNRYRLLGSFDASSSSTLDILGQWNQVFGGGGYVAGMTAMLRMYVISKGGLRSAAAMSTAVAT